MGYLLNAADVGYYAVAVGWAEMLFLLTNSVQLVFFPKISVSTMDEANHITPILCRNLLLITIPMAIILSIGATLFGPALYGRAFAASIIPMYWIMPGIWIFGLVKILSGDLFGRGLPELTLLPLGVATLADILFNFLLVPWLGVKGASLSSTLSYTIASIIIVVTFSKVSGVTYRRILIPERSDWQLYRVQLNAGWKTLKNILS
jgi:O-antigen/teichoic acid export membrane protein